MASGHNGSSGEAYRAAWAVVEEAVVEEAELLTKRLVAGEVDAQTFVDRVAVLTSAEVLETRVQQILNTSATPAAVKEAMNEGRSVLKFGDVVLAIQGETISEEEREERFRLARREMRRIVRDKLGFDV